MLDRRGGDKLLTASKDRSVKLWNPERGACLRTLAGHQGVANSAGFLPGRRVGAPSSADHTAKGCTCYSALRTGKLSHCVVHGFLLSTPKSDGCKIYSALRKGKLSRIFSWLSSVLYIPQSDGRHFYSALRRGKRSRFFPWLSVFYIAKSDGCNFYSALRRGKLSRILFMVLCFLHNQRRRVQLLLRSERGETLVNFVHGFLFSKEPKATGATYNPL